MTVPEPKRWERQPATLHEEILAQLRKYVTEQAKGFGARIPERELCDRLGISRTPLREALKVLAAEGLVELLPNRGSRIRELNARDIRELFEVIGGLEAAAGRLACKKITEEAVHAVEQLHLEMYSAYVRRDLDASLALNHRIHAAIIEAAENWELAAAHRTYEMRIRRLRFLAVWTTRRDRWSQAIREHEIMLDALVRRSATELSDIMFEHMMNKCASVLEQIEDASRAGSSASG